MSDRQSEWGDFKSKLPPGVEPELEVDETSKKNLSFTELGPAGLIILVSIAQLLLGGLGIMIMSSIFAGQYQQFAPGFSYWTSVILSFWLGIVFLTVGYKHRG
jgi:hypothetical protein